MMNLLKETLEILKENNKSPKDVLWVGNEKFWFTWKDFEELANIEYDDGYGAPKVAEDLLVVGKNWWLERFEYDGAECWKFKKRPRKPRKYFKPVRLTVKGTDEVGWKSLEELNKEVL